MASIGLDEASFAWHVASERRWRRDIRWNEYVVHLRDTFGMPIDQPMGELSRLRQAGTIAEFNTKFDSLSTDLDLPEDYLVKTYVDGLREDIANAVRLLSPVTMYQAQVFARMEETFLQQQDERARKSQKDNKSLKLAVLEEETGSEGVAGITKGAMEESRNVKLPWKGVGPELPTMKEQNSAATKHAKLSSRVNGSPSVDSTGGFQELSHAMDTREVKETMPGVVCFSSVRSCSSSTLLVSPLLTAAVADCLVLLGSHSSSLSPLPPLSPVVFAISNVIVSDCSVPISIDCALDLGSIKVTWLQKLLFEKSNLQLSSICSKGETDFEGVQLSCNFSNMFLGLEDSSKQKSPITQHLGFLSPTRILIFVWFKGELVEMLLGAGFLQYTVAQGLHI